jgi:hypothetical protein
MRRLFDQSRQGPSVRCKLWIADSLRFALIVLEQELKRHFIPILVIIYILGLAGQAQEQGSWQGYLVDRFCRNFDQGDNLSDKFAREHTRDCALLKECRESGFSLFSNGQWLDLDQNGNALAIRYLQQTKRQMAIYVSIDGTLDGRTIFTNSITEISEPQKTEKN